MKKIRFRTLGCYPLTGGMESEADTLEAIIDETLSAVSSERTSRVIDHEAASSMERRKERDISKMQSLLKFITCGSVDDGKSTLIESICYIMQSYYLQIEKALELDSKVGSTEGKIDYSLLLDGLMAEKNRELLLMWLIAILQQKEEALLWQIHRVVKK